MITTVSSAAALNAALKTAHSGDTIELNPGSYTGVAINNLSFAGGVTITSTDLTHPAVLGDFAVMGSSGLTFQGVQLNATGAVDAFAFLVRNSNNIAFNQVSVAGSMDNDPSDDANGLSFINSDNITVTNSEFQQLGRAVAVGAGSNIVISGNYVHDIRSDGFDFAQVDHIAISNNSFTDFHKIPTDHPDAIQFWTTGTTAPSHDIAVTGNVITLGTGDGTQGIFFRDQLGNLPYANVTVSDNLVDGTGYNGIRIGHVNGLTVTNNVLTTNAGGLQTFYLVTDSDQVTSTNNQAINIGFQNDTNLTESGDVLNAAVTDNGAAELGSWLQAHGLSTLSDVMGTGSLVSPPSGAGGDGSSPTDPAPTGLPTGSIYLDAVTANLSLPSNGNIDGVGNSLNNVITGNAGSNVLYGLSGNDTLNDGGGTDTLVGGSGDDTYYVSNTGDVVQENANGGVDTIIAKGNYTLPANVENLIINNTVGNGWAATGNDLNNVITGNGGANHLYGMAGDDTLIGNGGNDIMTGGSGADRFVFAPGAGHDAVTDAGANGDHDVIDLSAYYNAGLHAALSENSSGVTLTFTNGDTIVLAGQHIANMHATSIGFVF